MYQPRRSFSNRNSSRSFRPRGQSRQGRQPRSFDPSHLIGRIKDQPVLDVVKITHAFSDFKINETIKANISANGYSAPTPIQDQVIPLILDQKDVVGVANTGTGKTAAFLIPLINKASQNPQEKTLIITPTRELADQIEAEFIALARNMRLFSVLCIGGVGMGSQINGLRRSPQFVVGTPGRLKDLLQRRMLDLSRFTTIVLDEVDRMLDMGFIQDVQHLISFLPHQRQSLFFSATLEGKVREVMNHFLQNPVIVSVKTGDVSDHVDQQIIRLNGKNKIDVLHDILIKPEFSKVLVFGRTKWSMEKLAKTLIDRGFKATAIHGNKTQGQRKRALNQFKNGEVQILLATDVAQRGLDIDDVTHVINFDLPETEADYVHRIGRTGRADKKGIAITLLP